MAQARGGFRDKLFNKFMPVVYGVGAAIVIVGAMFKIMHWEGADLMLIVGLSTEAIIFFLSAFQPAAHEVDWTRVYPELSDEYQDKLAAKSTTGSVTQKLDDMLEQANIRPDLIQSLGNNLNNLVQTTSQMADLSQATVATNEYTERVRSASSSLEQINQAYASTAAAITQLSDATMDAREYHQQVQNVTKNLGALNAVYEMELQDANNHLKSMNRFYGTLSSAMENMTEASRESENFRNEVAGLTKNLHSLNNVYGNMLNAMRAQ
jgi:gliding motility-associated protein GldL